MSQDDAAQIMQDWADRARESNLSPLDCARLLRQKESSFPQAILCLQRAYGMRLDRAKEVVIAAYHESFEDWERGVIAGLKAVQKEFGHLERNEDQGA